MLQNSCSFHDGKPTLHCVTIVHAQLFKHYLGGEGGLSLRKRSDHNCTNLAMQITNEGLIYIIAKSHISKLLCDKQSLLCTKEKVNNQPAL